MKRLIVIFLIAIFLLSFMEIPLAKEGPINYGKIWLEASIMNRVYFTLGFVAGMDLWSAKVLPGLITMAKKNILNDEEKGAILDLIELRAYFAGLGEGDDRDYEAENFCNIITDLYRDPANTFITVSTMVEIAYKRLKGEDIAPLLLEARGKVVFK